MVLLSDLKPADHIYSWRKGYFYAHHGIYVGEGKVIHFTTGQGGISSSAAICSDPCDRCGYRRGKHDGVIITCIDCFLCGGDALVYQYSVPLLYSKVARGGTCSRSASDPPADVLHRAYYLLRNGFRAYNLFSNNCEDFSLYCKTGLLRIDGAGRSGQVRMLDGACGFSFFPFMNTTGLVAGAIMDMCFTRKIPVEELARI